MSHSFKAPLLLFICTWHSLSSLNDNNNNNNNKKQTVGDFEVNVILVATLLLNCQALQFDVGAQSLALRRQTRRSSHPSIIRLSPQSSSPTVQSDLPHRRQAALTLLVLRRESFPSSVAHNIKVLTHVGHQLHHFLNPPR